MTKLNFELGQKLAKFDFKQIMDECGGKCNDSDIKRICDLLEKVKHCKEKREEREKAEAFCTYKYSNNGNELDDSDGNNKYIRAIYNILWGRIEKRCTKNCKHNYCLRSCTGFGENGYSNFRTLFISEKMYGGDVANTVQTVLNWATGLNKKKYEYNDFENLYDEIKKSNYGELFDCYHNIGNFVLVPAYFNGYRGLSSNKLYDFFDASLYQLKKDGWDVASELARKIKITYKGKIRKALKETMENLENLQHCPVHTEVPKIERDVSEEGIRKYINSKVANIYKKFIPEDFNTYINTMFLWDYTKKQGDDYIIKSLCTKEFIDEREGCEYVTKDEVEEVENRRDKLKESSVRKLYVHNAKYAIERRSYFVVAMLRIALDVNLEGEKYKYIYNDIYFDNWGTWEVSPIYKQIMYEVFLNNDRQRYIYSGYMDVISEILIVVENMHIDKMAKDYINTILNDVIEKLDEVKCESRQQLYTYLDKTIPVP